MTYPCLFAILTSWHTLRSGGAKGGFCRGGETLPCITFTDFAVSWVQFRVSCCFVQNPVQILIWLWEYDLSATRVRVSLGQGILSDTAPGCIIYSEYLQKSPQLLISWDVFCSKYVLLLWLFFIKCFRDISISPRCGMIAYYGRICVKLLYSEEFAIARVTKQLV